MIAQLAVILAAVVLLAPGLLGLWRPGRRHPITVPERPATARPTSARARRQPPDASWATTLERLARDTSTGVALAAAIDHAAEAVGQRQQEQDAPGDEDAGAEGELENGHEFVERVGIHRAQSGRGRGGDGGGQQGRADPR